MSVVWDVTYTTQYSSTMSQSGGSGATPYALTYSDTYGKYYNGVQGLFGQRLWTSTDGMAWSFISAFSYGVIYAVHAYGQYVIAPSSYRVYVFDGFSWSLNYPDPTYAYLWLSGVVNGVFFVGGASTNTTPFTEYRTATNPTDNTWTLRYFPISDVWYGSRTISGKCYVFGHANTLVSTDAVNWTIVSLPGLPTGQYWCDIVFFNNRLVATSRAYTTGVNNIYTAVSTNNGASWTLGAPLVMSSTVDGGPISVIAANNFGIMRQASSSSGSRYIEQFSVDGVVWFDFVDLPSYRAIYALIGREGQFQASVSPAFAGYFTSQRWVAIPTIKSDIPPDFWQDFHAATETP